MARRRADLPDAEALRTCIYGERRLAVRVTPGARDQSVALLRGATSRQKLFRVEI